MQIIFMSSKYMGKKYHFDVFQTNFSNLLYMLFLLLLEMKKKKKCNFCFKLSQACSLTICSKGIDKFLWKICIFKMSSGVMPLHTQKFYTNWLLLLMNNSFNFLKNCFKFIYTIYICIKFCHMLSFFFNEYYE